MYGRLVLFIERILFLCLVDLNIKLSPNHLYVFQGLFHLFVGEVTRVIAITIKTVSTLESFESPIWDPLITEIRMGLWQ